MKWQYLLNLSTTVKMTDLPRTRGRASTKSSPMSVKTPWGIGKEQPSRMEVLRLVPLAHHTRMNQVLHKLSHVREMKVAMEPVERALDSFMPVVVHRLHDLLQPGITIHTIQGFLFAPTLAAAPLTLTATVIQFRRP